MPGVLVYNYAKFTKLSASGLSLLYGSVFKVNKAWPGLCKYEDISASVSVQVLTYLISVSFYLFKPVHKKTSVSKDTQVLIKMHEFKSVLCAIWLLMVLVVDVCESCVTLGGCPDVRGDNVLYR